jgi:peptidoglycan hydrolase CwlO-like protein
MDKKILIFFSLLVIIIVSGYSVFNKKITNTIITTITAAPHLNKEITTTTKESKTLENCGKTQEEIESKIV